MTTENPTILIPPAHHGKIRELFQAMRQAETLAKCRISVGNKVAAWGWCESLALWADRRAYAARLAENEARKAFEDHLREIVPETHMAGWSFHPVRMTLHREEPSPLSALFGGLR